MVSKNKIKNIFILNSSWKRCQKKSFYLLWKYKTIVMSLKDLFFDKVSPNRLLMFNSLKGSGFYTHYAKSVKNQKVKKHLEDIYESIYTLPLWLFYLQYNEIRSIMLYSVKVLVKRRIMIIAVFAKSLPIIMCSNVKWSDG